MYTVQHTVRIIFRRSHAAQGATKVSKGGLDRRSSVIEVRRARTNNLRDVSLDIPKYELTVFTGVSGSGKSSLVFGTVAAESQRLVNETFSTFIQGFLPRLGHPDVDALRNLSMAIVIGQERIGTSSRSTVGTATDAYALLRLLFSRIGRPAIASASALSFNDPAGMCPACEGLGRSSRMNVDVLVDRDKSLNEGAILFTGFAVGSWFWSYFAKTGRFDPDRKLADYTKTEWELFLNGAERKVKLGTMNTTYEGLMPKLARLYLSKDVESLQPHIRAAVERAVAFGPCAECEGTRLNAAARACRIRGRSIAECAALEIGELADFVRRCERGDLAPVVGALLETLEALVEIGLGYLSLSRETSTLSGGESQRLKMVRQLGSSLTDVTYVFDEPSAGLHAHDLERVSELLLRLRDKGNTVLVVEHKPAIIEIADHVVDMGPGPGPDGGRIVYEGDVAGLRRSKTATGRHLSRRREIKHDVRHATGGLRIRHAKLHNLKDVTVTIPTGVLTVVTGVAGSGKSALVRGCLPEQHRDVVVVDQRITRGSRRSNLATYSGVLDPIRKAFAKANGVGCSPVQRQLEGRVLRVQGPRRPLHRPGLHGRRDDDLQDLRRPALHPGRPRAPPARQEHPRRVRAHRPGGGRLLHREARPTNAPSHERRRPRLRHARAAPVDAVWRRATAPRDGDRSRSSARRHRGLRPRRADHRAPHEGRRSPDRALRSIRRQRPHGHRDRAQPRRRRTRRLGHRPRARRGS
jgi:excinuclease UvrABC ATPase subunit